MPKSILTFKNKISRVRDLHVRQKKKKKKGFRSGLVAVFLDIIILLQASQAGRATYFREHHACAPIPSSVGLRSE
jgi:hypothetical protein